MATAAFPGVPVEFEARSKLTGEVYRCRFSHLWSAIATRHSDTLDCKFFVNGRPVIVSLALTGFVTFRERAGRELSDREASHIAAAYLKDCLETDGDTDRSELTVDQATVIAYTEKLGFLPSM